MVTWHRLVGIVGVLVFLGTGVYLATGFPELHGGDAAIRYQFRANHAYILLSSLANGLVGIHAGPAESAPRATAQRLGSALLLLAPAVFVVAFFVEPPRARPERLITTTAVVMLLAGTALHALARLRRRTPPPPASRG